MFFSCFRHQIVVYLPRNTSARFLTLKGIEYEKFKIIIDRTNLCYIKTNKTNKMKQVNTVLTVILLVVLTGCGRNKQSNDDLIIVDVSKKLS